MCCAHDAPSTERHSSYDIYLFVKFCVVQLVTVTLKCIKYLKSDTFYLKSKWGVLVRKINCWILVFLEFSNNACIVIADLAPECLNGGEAYLDLEKANDLPTRGNEIVKIQMNLM